MKRLFLICVLVLSGGLAQAGECVVLLHGLMRGATSMNKMQKELDEAGFLNPPEKRPAMVRNIRNLFQRTVVTEQDVRTLRGIVSSLTRVHKRKIPKP